MKTLVSTGALVILLGFARTASAEIRFRCVATDKLDECAFTVEAPDRGRMTNFVLAPGATRGLDDIFAGGRYCVAIGRKGTARVNWYTCTKRTVGTGQDNVRNNSDQRTDPQHVVAHATR